MKEYFFARKYKNGTQMVSSDGKKIHRAGGGKDKINFVLEELIKTHGIKNGSVIYKAFNQALVDASQKGKRKETGVLVLYEGKGYLNQKKNNAKN